MPKVMFVQGPASARARRHARVLTWVVIGVALGVSGIGDVGCSSSDREGPDPEPAGSASSAVTCSPDCDSDTTTSATATTPSYPRITRDLALTAGSDVAHLNRPGIPPHQMSNDGRIAMSRGSKVYLFSPEKISTSHWWESSEAALLASTTAIDLDTAKVTIPGYTFDKSILCDGTRMVASQQQNTPQPQACANDPTHDCYTLTLVGVNSDGTQITLASHPIMVEVANPKTSNASIAAVTYPGAMVTGSPLVFHSPTDTSNTAQSFLTFNEPTIAEDGHLLVFRVGNNVKDRTSSWTYPSGGKGIDIVYSAGGDTDSPCDVTQWTTIKAITRAHSDVYNATTNPRGVNGRYGFASDQLRDAKNVPIDAGSDLPGSYPWVDKQGRNVFFTVFAGKLYDQLQDPDRGGCPGNGSDKLAALVRYPTLCADGSDTGTECGSGPGYSSCQASGNTLLLGVAGLWTQGKIVLVDNRLSHTDYGLALDKGSGANHREYRRRIALYASGGPYGDGNVLVGGGRTFGSGPNYPAGYPSNSSFLMGYENMYQHSAKMIPRTPRDVVWFMSKGMATDEVVFDDFLDMNAIIVSDMIPVGDQTGKYWDGWNGASGAYDGVIRMQNAATSTARNVPAWGVVAGSGRAEPVGMGGIVGRGLWKEVNTALQFTVPAQTDAPGTGYYVGMFVDGRILNTNVEVVLVEFPDASYATVQVGATSTTQYINYYDSTGAQKGSSLLPTNLAFNGEWHHVGLNVSNSGMQIDLYVDGYLADQKTLATGIFGGFSAGGTFTVGHIGTRNGVRGWFDELRVVAVPSGTINKEVACNYARGSLVAVNSATAATLISVNDVYTQAGDYTTHSVYDAIAPTGYKSTISPVRYACVHNYTNQESAPSLVATNTTSLRQVLLFPEGPLHDGTPRPNSAANTFCQSCHQSPTGSLSPSALTFDGSTNMEDDRRRQPMQPPRLIFGAVPASYVTVNGNPYLPSASKTASATGRKLDQWTFP